MSIIETGKLLIPHPYRETVKRLLAFPPDTNIVWKSHDDSIAQRSAFEQARNEKVSTGGGHYHNSKRRDTLGGGGAVGGGGGEEGAKDP